jgi:hypothetical protein
VHGVPPLPGTKAQATVQRDIIRVRRQYRWSVERSARHYCNSAVEVVTRIVSQALETERGRVLKLGVGAVQAGKPRCDRGRGATVRAN